MFVCRVAGRSRYWVAEELRRAINNFVSFTADESKNRSTRSLVSPEGSTGLNARMTCAIP